ncbi:MAG: biopolymer transporter ExbD [Planctomycetia bacterium]|nr:biopolymer transporter ExbD [Planctomycetia bacterium]
MRSPVKRPRASLAFNMTPMIDIVFQLVIFFLVASNMARQEVQEALDLPSAMSRQPSAEEVERIIVNVLPTGEIEMGGQSLTIDQFRRQIGEARDRLGQDLEVRIRGDRAVPYRMVEPLMIASARSGLWNVAFSVIAPEDVRSGDVRSP